MSDKDFSLKSPSLEEVGHEPLPEDFTNGLDGEGGVKSAAIVAFLFITVGAVLILTNPLGLTLNLPTI